MFLKTISAGALAVLLLSGTGFAQSSEPDASVRRERAQPMQQGISLHEVMDRTFAMGLQTGQAMVDITAAKDRRIADLEALSMQITVNALMRDDYARACGDKPGCFTPAQ